MKSSYGLALAAVLIGGAALMIYIFTQKKKEEAAAVVPDNYGMGSTPVAGDVASEGSSGEMPEPIVQEPPYYGAPANPAEEYEYLAQMEREDKKECPWDHMRFDTLASCFHHILDVHGGVPDESGAVLEGQVPLLRYQKIPILIQVTNQAGDAIANQLVELRNASGGVLKAEYTDPTGGVDFTGLDPGRYAIVIDALPAYSQYNVLGTYDFIPVRMEMDNFSGGTTTMEFMSPFVQKIVLEAPSWSVVERFLGEPALVETTPWIATVDSLTMVDALFAQQMGRFSLAEKIGQHDAGFPQSFSEAELILIQQERNKRS